MLSARVPEPLPFAKYPGKVDEQWKAIYRVSETLAKAVLGLIVGELLDIITTVALAGRIPPAGTGSITPPEVMPALAAEMKAALEQLKFVNELAGHVTVADNKFSGLVPT
jgi:hypothetical protein